MSFISGTFLIFAAAVLAVYYIVRPKHRWIVLLAASGIFYLMCGWKSIFYILTTSLSVFGGALLIEKAGAEAADAKKLPKEEAKALRARVGKKKSRILLAVLLLNLGILAFTKYAPAAVNGVLSLLSPGAKSRTLSLFVPIGLSFYTFQALGYIIDVKRGKYPAEKNYARFALFVSFFPQIIQGPISRYDDLGRQLREEHPFDYDSFTRGLQLMLWGYFKKMVIADRVAPAVDMLFGGWESLGGWHFICAALFYSIQIYTDFSGGIDITRGLAQCLGIELPLNFERPFFARDLSEFWRRWHMTLGNWMKDYVFFPISLSPAWAKLGKWSRKHLGKNAGKTVPASLTAFIVFFIIGIWHGASLNYIVYGLYNAGIIAVSTLLEPTFKKITGGLRLDTKCFSWRLFQMIRTTVIVAFGRIIAHAATFRAAAAMIRGVFSGLAHPAQLGAFAASLTGGLLSDAIGISRKDLVVLCAALAILLIVGILQERGFRIRETIARQNLPFRWLIWIALLFTVLIFGVYGLKYDAASFIYGGF